MVTRTPVGYRGTAPPANPMPPLPARCSPSPPARPARGLRLGAARLVPLALVALVACRQEPAANVILVSLDTTRFDRVGAVDETGQPLTPALDRFRQEALVFDRAFSQANETLFSHASLFLGRYPSQIGELEYASFRLPQDAETLAVRLSRAGWRTEAVVAGGHMVPAFGLDVGFQRYASMADFGSFRETLPEATDRLALLADQDRPFLLLVHGYDAHIPYVKPGPLLRLAAPGYDGPFLEHARSAMFYEAVHDRRFYPHFEPPFTQTPDHLPVPVVNAYDQLAAWAKAHPDEGIPIGPDDARFLVGAYDTSVSVLDYHVGVLLDAIDRSPAADRTWVILFSDHGEDLLAHGTFNHRSTLHDENTHVFLAIRGPGLAPGTCDDPVALLDVLPTVLEIAGLPADPTQPGHSLLQPTDPDRAIWSEAARGQQTIRTREGRLILRRDADPLATVQDAAPPWPAWVGDDANQPVDWTDPRVARLAARLAEAAPE